MNYILKLILLAVWLLFITSTSAQNENYLGTYLQPDGKLVQVIKEGNGIQVSGEGFPNVSLKHKLDNVFTMEAYNIKIEFVKDKNDKNLHMFIYEQGKLQMNNIKWDSTNKIDATKWTLVNRNGFVNEDEYYLNSRNGDGFLWVKDSNFSNGTIEFDIKGKNDPGRSFVGIAFHGLNQQIYDAVYFRPFNFNNPQKKQYSVQYISLPDHTWDSLRGKNPGKFENEINTSLDPNDWFHVKIEINYPIVKVYINNSKRPTLKISQLSNRKKGLIGFLVGNNSEGFFRSLNVRENK